MKCGLYDSLHVSVISADVRNAPITDTRWRVSLWPAFCSVVDAFVVTPSAGLLFTLKV